MDEATRIELPGMADMHVHLRQGPLMRPVIEAHLSAGARVVLAMPNTSPPVSRPTRACPGDGWSVPEYRDMVLAAGGDGFQHLVLPYYLTRDTTPGMVAAGAREGVRTVKSYPPHGTTNSDSGVPLGALVGGEVLRAMEAEGVTLCIHGERHGVSGEEWFGRHGNAEETFYREEMPRLRDAHPGLRVVCEHITTAVAAAFVAESGDGFGATVTPMHLLYPVGFMLQGWFAHLKCMPLLKFDADVAALRASVTAPGNRRFFAGTDSAPHPKLAKATDCGCASGCFTANVAPQLYAEAFEAAGVDLGSEAGVASLRAFLCENGPDHHGVPRPEGRLVLRRSPQEVRPIPTEAGELVPLPAGLVPDREGRSATIPWCVEA